MNLCPKRGIMARCKLMVVVKRRESRAWTWSPRSEFWANPPGEVCLRLSYVPIMCTRTQSGHIPLAYTHNTYRIGPTYIKAQESPIYHAPHNYRSNVPLKRAETNIERSQKVYNPTPISVYAGMRYIPPE